jgi:hypothetical protein
LAYGQLPLAPAAFGVHTLVGFLVGFGVRVGGLNVKVIRWVGVGVQPPPDAARPAELGGGQGVTLGVGVQAAGAPAAFRQGVADGVGVQPPPFAAAPVRLAGGQGVREGVGVHPTFAAAAELFGQTVGLGVGVQPTFAAAAVLGHGVGEGDGQLGSGVAVGPSKFPRMQGGSVLVGPQGCAVGVPSLTICR